MKADYYRLFILSMAIVVLTWSFKTAVSAASPTNTSYATFVETAPTYLDQWGSTGSSHLQFSSINGMATDSIGNIYIADTANDRIVKYSSSGTFNRMWGRGVNTNTDTGAIEICTGISLPCYAGIGGAGTLQFEAPFAVAVSPDDLTIYVADSGNDRIKRFSSNGVYLGSWGVFGSSSGAFNNPLGIAVDRWGNVFVADTNNNRIQKFSPLGDYITQWNSGGGNFSIPFGVTVDHHGDVYVADSGNHRIQKFDNQGNFLFMWGGFGTGFLQFKFPIHLTIDSDNNLYVVDSNNDRIMKFDSNAVYLAQVGSSGTGNGQFQGPSGIAVNREGDFVVSDSTLNRIQKLRPAVTKRCQLNGNIPHYYNDLKIEVSQDQPFPFINQWGTTGTGNGQFQRPTDVVIDSTGNIFVLDVNREDIQKFDANFNHIITFGTGGGGGGTLNFPLGLAVDGAGNIYVADTNNHLVKKFNNNGGYLTQWGGLGTGNGKFDEPVGITVNSFDEVLVTERGNNRVQIFTTSGSYINRFGGFGTGNGQFDYPAGIGTDRKGNIYIAEQDNDRIQKFNRSGSYLTQWGSQGNGNGQFDTIFGIAVTADGTVYVTDSSSNDRVQKFDNVGNYLAKWGGSGTGGNGSFNTPKGVAITSDGSILVTEIGTGDTRVQKFHADACLEATWFGVGHPSGPSGISTTGQYWDLVETGAITVDITLDLPSINYSPASVCRHLGSGMWDCAKDQSTILSVTRNDVSEFSDWALGNCNPIAVPTATDISFTPGPGSLETITLTWSASNSTDEIWRSPNPYELPGTGSSVLDGTSTNDLYEDFVSDATIDRYFYHIRGTDSACGQIPSTPSIEQGVFQFAVVPGT